MISIACGSKYTETMGYLKQLKELNDPTFFDRYGRMGVEALRSATPKDTGLTSESWSYRVVKTNKNIKLIWDNSNYNKGVPVALVIQYGHATPSGAYVQGIDYINPAMAPVFEAMAAEIRKELESK